MAMISKANSSTAALHTSLPVGSPERAQLQQNLSPPLSHGGPKSKGKRKSTRPWNSHAPVLLRLESTRAKGAWSLLHRRHRSQVQSMIFRYAERFKVRIYRASNTGKELHLLVKASERKHLADYLRVLAGRVAITVTGAKKGVKKVGKFWEFLTFSKLIRWGQEFFSVSAWVLNLADARSTSAANSSDTKHPDSEDHTLPLPLG